MVCISIQIENRGSFKIHTLLHHHDILILLLLLRLQLGFLGAHRLLLLLSLLLLLLLLGLLLLLLLGLLLLVLRLLLLGLQLLRGLLGRLNLRGRLVLRIWGRLRLQLWGRVLLRRLRSWWLWYIRVLLRRRAAALRRLRAWLRLRGGTLGIMNTLRLRRGSLLRRLLSRVCYSVGLVRLLRLMGLLSLLLRLLLRLLLSLLLSLLLGLLHSNELLLLLKILRLPMWHLLLQVYLHVHGPHIRVGLHRSQLSSVQRLGAIWQ